jgi:hypothetical protein
MSGGFARQTVTLEGLVLKETEKALLFRLKEFQEENNPLKDREEWFPLSTVWEIHHTEPFHTIVVDSWIAEKKELV